MSMNMSIFFFFFALSALVWPVGQSKAAVESNLNLSQSTPIS